MATVKAFSMFLQRAFEKILADKEIKKNYNSELKSECEASLERLQNKKQKEVDGETHHLPEAGSQLLADDFFKPFQLACRSRTPRIVSTALDCLQKLIAYGQLVGSEVDPDNNNKKLIDTVIDTICEAFHGVNTDPDVELQIIKALLTAVTSQSCDVHEMALLTAVRCCYNINLFTKNQVNQATAKATLTQMLSVCFTQMEYHSQHLLHPKEPSKPEPPKEEPTPTVEVSPETPEVPSETPEVPSETPEASPETPEASPETPEASPETPEASPETPEVYITPDSVTPEVQELNEVHQTNGYTESHTGSEMSTGTSDSADDLYKVSKDLVDMIINDAMTEIGVEGGEKEADGADENEIKATDEEGAEEFGEMTGEDKTEEDAPQLEEEPSQLEEQPPQLEEKPSQLEEARETGEEDQETAGEETGGEGDVQEEEEKEVEKQEEKKEGEKKKNIKFENIYMRDAYLVLRTLCKMTMQPLPDGPLDPRSHEMRSKMLALELLLCVMQNSGPVMRTHRTFAQLIKQFLCVALSKNGVSPVPGVFQISLSIFLILISSFKSHLKMQIEVFFKDIFLSILESPSSSFQHKWFVMQALARVCADPQIIVDIYLNYDCDMVLDNIFERLVNDISRIAQGHLQEWGLTPQQQHSLQHKGMECLVSILKCLVEWSKDMYKRPGEEPFKDKSAVEEEPEVDDRGTPEISRSGLGARSGSQSSLASAVDNPAEFEDMKKQKSIFEEGIAKFNKKFKHGLKFLQDAGLLGTAPTDVAKFFHSDERLSKSMIGEVLGDENTHNKEIMYAYVDMLEFGDVDFVKALRVFLAGFRLPGEAQKIDRLMLKFAQRYFENNPNLGFFASADTAYVLAYSIIMLTTDLHNDQVKNKITKPQYIRMNSGINDTKDLPQEYLEAIYDEISVNEIKMRYDKADLKLVQNTKSNNEQKRQMFNETMVNLGRNAHSIMEGVSKKDTTFTSAAHSSHVRPMLMLTWTPFLAVFSITLQDSNDPELIALCLDGFRCAVRVSCIFNSGLVRAAYIQSLARFTMLNVNSGFSEIKPKNLETIKTLIAIAFTDCNYLEESWYDILKVISQLELAQLIGTGVKTKFLEKEQVYDKKMAHNLQATLGDAANQSVIVAVDRIFTGSPRLDGNAIVHFTAALCRVSAEELTNPAFARMFSLQKIVEISYYNMGRIRFEWSKIWHVIGEHFNKVGCNQNEEVAIFAVDSLRQLAMKFIEKGELPNYKFQKDFLRPFEHIMKNNSSSVIRDMVVRCVAQMVNTQAANIRSGWNNIFSVFHIAAADQDQAIVELAFQTTASIFDQYFSATVDSFQDAVKCLSEFACNAAFPDTSMEAIRFIRKCANYVAQNPEQFCGDDNNHDAVWVKGWFPVLFELSCIINRCKLDVRTRALTVMFEIMKTHGHMYRESWWKDLFKIVFRIFDDMKIPEQNPEQYRAQRREWMTTTCNHALYAVVDVYTQHYAVLAPLLSELLQLLQWCVKQDNEQLARSGMNCLENLVMGTGKHFREDCWVAIVDTITQVYANTLPVGLRNWKPSIADVPDAVSVHSNASDESSVVSYNDKVLFHNIQINCLVQAEIIQTVDNIIFFPASSTKEDQGGDVSPPPEGMFAFISTSELFRIVDCLIESHNFAKGFNMDTDQRNLLWKYGFKGKTLPNLQKQETSSLQCALRILYKVYTDVTRVDDWPRTELNLHRLTLDTFNYYTTIEADSRRVSCAKVVILMLKKMMLLDDDRFLLILAKCYDVVCAVIALNNKPDLQLTLSQFLLRAKRPLFGAENSS